MTARIYESFGFPDSCHLGKRVFKKLFEENADLTAADRRAFTEDIETVTWQYTLKPSTIQIAAFEDAEREYHEIAVLDVGLKTQKRTARIAEVIHRAIPYPVILVLGYSEGSAPEAMLSLASKRLSRAERNAIVADEFLHTEWLDLAAPTPMQAAFLASLAVRDLPHTDFLAFYSALIDRVLALQASRLSGQFRICNATEEREARRQRLAECRAIEGQIAELRAALRDEPHFNRQVDLNTRIKELERRLATESQGA